jgi:hypothetical protein
VRDRRPRSENAGVKRVTQLKHKLDTTAPREEVESS